MTLCVGPFFGLTGPSVQNVVLVEFDTTLGYRITNMSLSSVSIVPEPSTSAMLLAGLSTIGLLISGGMLRRPLGSMPFSPVEL